MPAANRTYWLTTACRIARKDNTLVIDRGADSRVLPIEDVRDLIAAAPVEVNTSLISLLNHHRIDIHFLNYYGDYTGSLLGADTSTSGTTVAAQVRLADDPTTSLPIARALVDAAGFNVRRVIGRDLLTAAYATLKTGLTSATSSTEIMAAEGNFRRCAWEALDTKLPEWLQLDGRSRKPPRNAGNAFISYVNGIVYSRVLSALRLTPLHTGVGFLHATLQRHRHTLALDLAEVFRPVFAERLLLRMSGRRQLKEHHFEANVNQAMLSETGRRLVIEAVREEMLTTVAHRTLKRDVSYEELIYLDALQLVKTCLEGHAFSPFRIWW
jgi:CRISPR-associated protein Cas1